MRPAWITVAVVAAACGPDLAPVSEDTGSSSGGTGTTGIGESTRASTTGADTTATADSGSSGSSTGEPEPLPCINIEPADGDVCYVEHLLAATPSRFTLSDQDGDGRLDIVFGGNHPCCDDAELGPGGMWIMRGDPEGSFGEPELLAEVEGGWDWLLPLGPGPDGVSRVVTQRGVDVGFLVVPEYGELVGESFLDETPTIPECEEDEVEAGDVDGDGVLDFLALADSAVYVGLSLPDGAFDFTPYDVGLGSLGYPLAGDEDGDGLDDVLLVHQQFDYTGGASYNDYWGAWSHAQPGAGLEPVPPVGTWSMLVGVDLKDPRLVDVDGDGILDVFSRHRHYLPATMSLDQTRLVIARGIEGGFEVQVETELDDEVLAMEPMHLQDGTIGAAVRHEGAEDELWLMRLTDALSFEPAMRLGLTHTPTEGSYEAKLAVADLNADGHDDFVTLVHGTEPGWQLIAVVSRPE